MNASAKFVCFDRCGGEYPIDTVALTCESCGALLDVEHDVETLAQTAPEQWRGTFERRWMRPEWPNSSGVWGKREWVLPHLSDDDIVSFAEGGSALLKLDRYGEGVGLPDLWLKQCGNSHTGSFKDLGMTVLVSAVRHMIRAGRPVRAIACASTGDTSAAMAAYCAAAGIPGLVLLPKNKVSTAQLVQPLAHGATVLSLDTDFDGCMALVRQLADSEGIYLANSMNCLRLEGQKTVGVEIIQQLGWQVPDWIVIPGGNLGNVYALGRGLELMLALGIIDRRPRICVAQAAHANPLYRAYKNGWSFEAITAQSTAASAIQIGDPVSIHRAIRVMKAFDGVVEEATEDELADAVARADRTGTYCCPHTGVALAATEKLVRTSVIGGDARVVVVSTAHGLKFTEFKLAYHEARLAGAPSRHNNTPVELPADLDAVRRALDARFAS